MLDNCSFSITLKIPNAMENVLNDRILIVNPGLDDRIMRHEQLFHGQEINAILIIHRFFLFVGRHFFPSVSLSLSFSVRQLETTFSFVFKRNADRRHGIL